MSREHIARLPALEAPELFGLHPNAVIAFELREARHLVDAVLSMQPRVAPTGGAVSPDAAVAERAAEVLGEVPAPLTAPAAASDGHHPGRVDSLAVVLTQEVER
jgi:dynein heavy chain